MTPLKQLVYVSASTTEMTEQDLMNLMQPTLEANRHHDISGLLLYKTGSFIQVIEGSGANVSQLYQNLLRDPRHTSVLHLITRTIDQREFPDWAMGFRNLSSQPPPAGFSDFLINKVNQDWDTLAGTEAMVLLSSFRDS